MKGNFDEAWNHEVRKRWEGVVFYMGRRVALLPPSSCSSAGNADANTGWLLLQGIRVGKERGLTERMDGWRWDEKGSSRIGHAPATMPDKHSVEWGREHRVNGQFCISKPVSYRKGVSCQLCLKIQLNIILLSCTQYSQVWIFHSSLFSPQTVSVLMLTFIF